MKFLKYAFLVLMSFLVLTIGFYLWASSPNLSPTDYAVISEAAEINTEQNGDEFRILTYNIGYLSGMTNNLPVEKPRSLFEDNMQRVLDNLKRIDADLLAFQEIDYDSDRSYNINQHEVIGELGYRFSAKTVNWDKRYVPFPYYPVSMHFGKVISGQSVLSKYPILEQERIELERNQDNPFYYDSFYLDRLAQVVKVRVAGHNLVLIHVHLEAFDQATRIHQIEKLRSIYAKYYKDGPTIMLGDFNSDPRYENAGIELMEELIHTGSAAFDRNDFQNTYNSRQPTERLDYIFYNTDYIEEIKAEVVDEFDEASDHLPVLLTFKFNSKKYGTASRHPDT
ncbi:MAG: endonuclease/exonuclease/phosphatase family protein [Lutimonas sp.]